MAFTDMIAALRRTALDDLEHFDREQALDAGFSRSTVLNWQRVHKAYYGPTTSAQKQRLALSAAQNRGLSLDKLSLIERELLKVNTSRAKNSLRLKLLAVKGDYSALRKLARKLVPGANKPPQKRLTISGSKRGRRTVVITADERDVADLEAALMHGVDRSQPLARQLLAHFLALIRNGGGVPHAVPRPLLLVGLPDYVKIVEGRGDDVVLGLSDGTTMTGAQYVNHFVAKRENALELALFHPAEGAVNLYREERFANQKQRDLVRATQPVCTSPDCRHGADNCEIHHIKAWKHGGETNINNLAPLCSYHNRVNDDDPRKPKRGRIEMRNGSPVWVSPRGFARANERHPFGAMRTLYGARAKTKARS